MTSFACLRPPLAAFLAGVMACTIAKGAQAPIQLTHARSGHQIHNRQCFSPDGRFIYYDDRNKETLLGDSRAIGRVEIATGRAEILHRTADSAIGAVTCHPRETRLAFILGIPGLEYAPHQRGAATLAADGSTLRLDARDVHPPFTWGASRGGSHAFHWSPDGTMLSFTYNDALVPRLPPPQDLRTIGILIPGRRVNVENPEPPGDFNGSAAMATVVPLTPEPRPGSDEILRAFDEDWLDERTLVFQGIVLRENGDPLTELFLAKLPAGLTAKLPPAAENAQLARSMPPPLPGVTIHRLTHTENRSHPGIQGPRHWVRVSPDRTSIAFLARDAAGIVQIHSIPPTGGEPHQVSRLTDPVQDVFDWSPCGKFLACIAGGSIQLIEASSGVARQLTPPQGDELRPRYAATFSPDGQWIATNQPKPHPGGGTFLQILLVPNPVEK